jgi:uncharacterized membrane protein
VLQSRVVRRETALLLTGHVVSSVARSVGVDGSVVDTLLQCASVPRAHSTDSTACTASLLYCVVCCVAVVV